MCSSDLQGKTGEQSSETEAHGREPLTLTDATLAQHPHLHNVQVSLHTHRYQTSAQDARHEAHVVPLDALHRVARRFPGETPIVDKGYIIIGSPDEVVAQLTEVATELNVGHLMLLLQFGNMGKDLAKYNTKLFAEKVLPRLQPLFAEWEDKWWPQPIDNDLRADVAPFVPNLAAE